MTDIEKLKLVIDGLWFPTQHFENKLATEVEKELIEKFESYKIWAYKIITEKLK